MRLTSFILINFTCFNLLALVCSFSSEGLIFGNINLTIPGPYDAQGEIATNCTGGQAQELVRAILLRIPNPLLDEVPDGPDESANLEIRKVGQPREFDFKIQDHVEIAERLGGLDLKRAAKISGARFAFLSGSLSRLNRALAQFFLDYHANLGDTELTPPYLVRPEAMQGTGQLPKFKEDAFEIPGHDSGSLYLIPTAEVPVTNYHADEILDLEELPKRYSAYSACFRAEAGAAGRDTRGLIRQHQFEKVEMVRFCTPEQAEAELQNLVDRASDLLTKLELPHRVMLLCAGDTGFSAQKTYDLEVWLPGQNAYREISSCSSFGSFQARRAQIRYKDFKNPKSSAKPIVTLNGSGLPLGRTLVAILENHQQADGSVKIPEALRSYVQSDWV